MLYLFIPKIHSLICHMHIVKGATGPCLDPVVGGFSSARACVDVCRRVCTCTCKFWWDICMSRRKPLLCRRTCRHERHQEQSRSEKNKVSNLGKLVDKHEQRTAERCKTDFKKLCNVRDRMRRANTMLREYFGE